MFFPRLLTTFLLTSPSLRAGGQLASDTQYLPPKPESLRIFLNFTRIKISYVPATSRNLTQTLLSHM